MIGAKIGVAAYDGNHLAKVILAGLHWSKQVWHITFGHMGTLNPLLPDTYAKQFLVYQCQDVGVHAYWSTCPCGITQQLYQAMVLDED